MFDFDLGEEIKKDLFSKLDSVKAWQRDKWPMRSNTPDSPSLECHYWNSASEAIASSRMDALPLV